MTIDKDTWRLAISHPMPADTFPEYPDTVYKDDIAAAREKVKAELGDVIDFEYLDKLHSLGQMWRFCRKVASCYHLRASLRFIRVDYNTPVIETDSVHDLYDFLMTMHRTTKSRLQQGFKDPCPYNKLQKIAEQQGLLLSYQEERGYIVRRDKEELLVTTSPSKLRQYFNVSVDDVIEDEQADKAFKYKD